MGWGFYFSVFCAAHLDLIALILLNTARKNRSNLYLAIFLILFSFVHWQNAILLGGYIREFRYIDPLCGILLSLCGPFFLFYIRSITASNVFSLRRDYFHLIPMLVSVIHFTRTLFWEQKDFDSFYYAGQNSYAPFNKLLLMLMLGYFICYLVWGLILIRKYSDKLQDFSSNHDRIRLDWLKYTLYILAFMASLMAPALVLIGDINLMITSMLYFSTMLYLWIVFKSINHSTVFINEITEIKKITEPEISENTESSKYQGSALNPDKIEEYYNALNTYFTTHKPFLNPDLSLKMLSDLTSIPPHYISRIVNQFYGKSFFDLINYLRVEEFKDKLKNPANKKFSLEGLAFDSGFGSKASFQRAFLKNMNITPSEYRRSLAGQEVLERI